MVHQLRTHTNPEAPGCVETLRSTSGLVLTCGIHVLKTQISEQSTVVLSSGEAELCSVIHEILQEHSALSERVSHQVVLVSVTQGIRDVQGVKTFLELKGFWDPDYTPDKKTLKHVDASDKDMLGEGGTFEGGFKTMFELQVVLHLSSQSWKDMPPKHMVLVCEQMKEEQCSTAAS